MNVLAVTATERAEFFTFVPLALLSVAAAVGMVLSRNAVYSALLLVVNFFCLAGFYVLLEAQFIAAVQVIVYAGGFGSGSGSLAAANQGGNVQAVGRLLFTRYVFAFEAVGMLLVVAAVGALVLGKRRA